MRRITEAEIIAGLDAMLARQGLSEELGNIETKLETERKPEARFTVVQRDWMRLASDHRRHPTMKDLMMATARLTGCSTEEMRSPRRWQVVVRARMIYYTLCKELTSYSLVQIGRTVGHRDHSTVLHGINRVKENPGEFQPELGMLMQLFSKPESSETEQLE